MGGASQQGRCCHNRTRTNKEEEKVAFIFSFASCLQETLYMGISLFQQIEGVFTKGRE